MADTASDGLALPVTSLRQGQDLGPSDWVHVTQDMISLFGAATLDLDPMHVDPEWARNASPYGGTIAFGFLTMSLLTPLIHAVLQSRSIKISTQAGHFLNYGFDRLRLVAPVKANQRIRGHFCVLKADTDGANRLLLTFGCEIEIEGGSRPALVAEWLAIWIPRDVPA